MIRIKVPVVYGLVLEGGEDAYRLWPSLFISLYTEATLINSSQPNSPL